MRSAASQALLLLSLLLAGCDGGEQPAEPAVVATKSGPEGPKWLSPTDATEPALWLASQEPRQSAETITERTDHLRHSLARAKRTFIEDPRMIANRTVQLGQMLAEAGQGEDYSALLDGLEAAAATSHRKQLFGELCQHYYNSRQQGLDRTKALVRLTDRYAAQAITEGDAQ